MEKKIADRLEIDKNRVIFKVVRYDSLKAKLYILNTNNEIEEEIQVLNEFKIMIERKKIIWLMNFY